MTGLLYDKMVEVIEEYLGPASQRFVDRQIENHLQIDPKDLTAKDIEPLSEWIKVSLSLLTSDRQAVDDCIEKLRRLN